MKTERIYKNGRAWRSVTGFIAAVLIIAAVCAITWRVGLFMSRKSVPSSASGDSGKRYPTVVIDAGHGGMDSGTVGVDGSLEKTVNLAVAQRIYELCRLAGIDCVMTRTDDNMLVDDSVKSRRKMHDLKNRLAIAQKAESEGGAVLVSIHMNNYTDPKYSGLQVWYSNNRESSAVLASGIQGYARTWIAPENKREIKRATSSIYILDRASMPAVLIECGFLSNPEECKKLGEESYRNELAACIFAAICDWLGDEA